ncbi:MAG TPA: PEGA domain-containing protein [Burkholderiales bacterium]|nr:PEGA domain-containing protein [Burkholderiales bacterium]
MNEPGSLPTLASVVFIRITEFARRPVPEQARLRAQLESALAVALIRIDERSRIILDAPDGMAIAVLGDPAGALDIAQRCMSASAAGVSMAVAINHGAIRLAADDGGQQGMIGDAVGTAAAIAHFAGPARLFVSRSFREALATAAPARAASIRPAGIFTDANVRTHELFAPDAASARHRRKVLAAVGVTVVFAMFTALVYYHGTIRGTLREGQPATLVLNVHPDGDVVVDGTLRGRSPPVAELKLAPGTHTIELRRKGEIPFRTSVDLRAGRTAAVEYEFSPAPERSLLRRLRDWVLP